jgi:hypothetical protein
MTSDGTTMIALRATPAGRCRFWRTAVSFVGAEALHRPFPLSSPCAKISTVLAIPSNVITL